MINTSTIIGKRIRSRRHDLGLTQEDIAKAIGVSKATVNKYETGIVTNFSRPRIEQLSKVLDCSPAWLLGWDQMTPEAQDAAMGMLKVYNTVSNNSGVMGTNNGTVYAEAPALTDEEQELIRLYKSLPVKARMNLLNYAYKLAEE